MSDDINAVITAAVSEAGLLGDSGGGDAGGDATPVGADAGTPETDAGAGAGAQPVEAAAAEGATSVEGAEPPVPVVEAAEETPEEPDELEREYGLKKPIKGRKENWMPHSRVRTMVKKAIDGTTAKLTGTHASAIQAKDAELAEYKGKVTYVDRLGEAARTHPERVLQVFRDLNPAFFDPLIEAAKNGGKPVQAQPVADANDPEPQADFQLPDKSWAYTTEQFKKHTAWVARQATREARAEMQTEMDKRLGPIEKERQAAAHREAIQPQINARMQWLEKLPMFNEHSDAVLTLMRTSREQGRPISAEGAYIVTVVPKLLADYQKMYQKVLKDIQSKPHPANRTPATPTRAATPAAGANPKATIEDVIRESVEAAGLL